MQGPFSPVRGIVVGGVELLQQLTILLPANELLQGPRKQGAPAQAQSGGQGFRLLEQIATEGHRRSNYSWH